MKNRFIIFITLFCISCNIYIKPRTIEVNTCNRFCIDSINAVLSKITYPFVLSSDGMYDVLNVANRYMIYTEHNGGYCFYSITEAYNHFYLYISEMIVGFDYYFIYNTQTKSLYITDQFNYNSKAYNVMYNTCNFADQSIMIQYTDSDEKEKIHFNICKQSIIRLNDLVD